MDKKTLKAIEQRRVILQTSLDARKTQEERNRLGQFATPPPLALEILAYAKKLLPNSSPVRFLDPAIGTGAFYSALLNTFPRQRIACATGFEIDPHYAVPTAELWKEQGISIKQTDFTAQPAPPTEKRFNLLICNPPYVRHHHLLNGEKNRLQQKMVQTCGVQLSGLAGLYCYFIGLAHTWMEENGIAGWLIPSEFMDVNYGKAIKEYLLGQVTLTHIHRFDPTELQFDDALVSSSVVWFRNTRPTSDQPVRFTFGGSLIHPRLERMVSREVLKQETKWTRFPVQDGRRRENTLTLSDFFAIKRGLATGANEYFILSREQIAEFDLPLEAFRPILPSPRYINENEIKTTAEGHPLIEKPLFLLDCRLSEEQIRQYPSLVRYLEQGKAQGIADRYLCRHRKPWYIQENRPAPPFICTYLGRQGTRDGRPFRFLLNHSQATVPNVYLALYPKPPLAQALREKKSLAKKVWLVLNNISIERIVGAGRVYGGGLHKLEPKELASVPVPELNTLLPGEKKVSYQMELLEQA